MTNGDNLIKHLARQLSKGTGEQSSGSNKSGRKRSPRVDFTDNPLFLAAGVAVPEGFPAGGVPAAQESGAPDLHIDVDPPVEAFNPPLNRQRSYGFYSTASSQTYYGSATNSPLPVLEVLKTL